MLTDKNVSFLLAEASEEKEYQHHEKEKVDKFIRTEQVKKRRRLRNDIPGNPCQYKNEEDPENSPKIKDQEIFQEKKIL